MSKQLRTSKVLAVAVASIVGSHFARAASVTWSGASTPTNPNWSDGTNWGGAAPGSGDTATFDSGGLANLSNTVDAALQSGAPTLSQLNYRVDDTTKTYVTSIDRNVTLTLGNAATYATATQVASFTNSSFVVVPANAVNTTTPVQTGVNVVIQSSGATGNFGGLSITSGNFLVTGRPGLATTADSYAILDLSNLDSFTFTQPLSPLVNGVFAIGQGSTGIGSGGTDNNAYWGRVILGPKSTIDANRVIVGGQNNAGSGTFAEQPVSQLFLADGTKINTNLSGNEYVGYDAASGKDSSGAMMFRAGLSGTPVANIGNQTHRNGLVVGSNRTPSTGHRAYGVIDATAASGGTDGALNGTFGGFISIGRASAGAGGSAGMISLDKGGIEANSYFFIGSTSSDSNAQPIIGTVNVGGTGAFETIRDGATGTDDVTDLPYIALSRRVNNNSSETMGVLNVSGAAQVEAERIFLAVNSGSGTGRSTGILNLNGGTVTAYQIQAGADSDTGATNTRLINFNGGTLQAKTGTTSKGYNTNFIADQASTAGGIQDFVYSGGGTFDTNGEDITVNTALQSPAGSSGLSSVSVTTGGSGYRAAPIVYISGGGGSGATAVAQINSSGAVTGITVTNPGTGYTSVPTIDLNANGGTNYANTLQPYGGVKAVLAGTISANSSGGFTKIGIGTLTLNGANTYTGPTTSNMGKLLFGQSMLTSSAMNATGGNIELAAGGSNVIKTGTMSTSGTSQINLQDNKAIVTGMSSGTASGGVYASGSVSRMVQDGRNGGTWDGSGVVTTQANASGSAALTTLGVASASETGYGGAVLFGGQSVAGSDVLVKYTYAGDANLDGQVNGDDYFGIDNGIGGATIDFAHGDFNYDGKINADDYFLIDRGYAEQGVNPILPSAPLGGVSAVPEPASIALLGVAAVGLIHRRRRG